MDPVASPRVVRLAAGVLGPGKYMTKRDFVWATRHWRDAWHLSELGFCCSRRCARPRNYPDRGVGRGFRLGRRTRTCVTGTRH